MAFVVNQNAWNAGLNMYDQMLARERQAKQDAIEAAREARTVEEYEARKAERLRNEKAAADQEAIMAEQARRAKEAAQVQGGSANWWQTQVAPAQAPVSKMQGIAPAVPDAAPVVNAPAVKAQPTEAAAPTNAVADNVATGAFAGDIPGMAGQQATPSQARVITPQMQQALTAMNMAMVARDRQGFMAAQEKLTAAQQAQDHAQLFQTAVKLPAEQRDQLLQRLSDNPGFKLKANYDKDSGLTTLTFDEGGKVAMNPTQFARFMVAQYKVSQGDVSGYADMEAIDGKLAQRMQADNTALAQVVSNNNTVNNTKFNQNIAANQDARQQSSSDQQATTFAAQQRALRNAELLQAANGDYERARQAGDRKSMNAAAVRIASLGGKVTDPDASGGVELKTDTVGGAYVIQKGKDGSAVVQKVNAAKGPVTIPSIGTAAREAEKKNDPRTSTGTIKNSVGAPVAQISQADLEESAKKYGMTVDQVKQKLGIK